MLLSAVSVLVVAQSSSEIPEGLMNNSVYNPHACAEHKCYDVSTSQKMCSVTLLARSLCYCH